MFNSSVKVLAKITKDPGTSRLLKVCIFHLIDIIIELNTFAWEGFAEKPRTHATTWCISS